MEPADQPREARPRPKIVQRLEAQRERHADRPKVVRALYAIAGTVVLVVGFITLVTPGPAFILIPLGLAMLSLEFVWAERLLERALEEGAKAQERAARTTPLQRVLTVVAGCLAVAAVLWIWASLGDVPIVPWF